MSMVDKDCEQCGAVMEVRSADLKRGRGKFCSLKCNGAWQSANRPKKEPNVECAHCGTAFYKSESKRKKSKSGLFFCTKSCKDITQRIGGLVVPSHYGTHYTTICFMHHKKECVVCGEDKVVAVHHYDENHDNNDPNNLVPLCPTHHQYVHSKHKHLVIDKIEKWRKNNIIT